jgi:16S rRNA (guanine527-N7)-methyltransferase
VEQSQSGFDKFISSVNVSRETLDKLTQYYSLLLKWQPRINLVSPKTVSESWERHFLDSAQLFSLLSDPQKPIFDFGSGAGFPGLVLSVMGASQIHLIESDQRKCAFLSEVIRQTGSTAKVLNQRIESLPFTGQAATVTSRACASLNQLLHYAAPLLAEDGECLFLKGRNAEQEVAEAQQDWLFHVEQSPSQTDSEACILRIRDLRKKS